MPKYVSIALFGKCLTTANDKTDGWPLAAPISKLGLEIVPLGDPRSTHFVAFDHSPGALSLALKSVPVRNRLLFAFEPEAVNPQQHMRSTRAKYGRVVIGSRRHRFDEKDEEMVFGVLPEVFVIPVPIESGPRAPLSVAMLNENKFSFVLGNLYKTRVEVIEELSEAGLPVSVGGNNWSRGLGWQLWRQALHLYAALQVSAKIDLRNFHKPLRQYKNLELHGRVPSETQFLSQFEFALVIENDPNYLSEKLLNAVMAGAIPLYLGPPLHEFGLPSNLAVQMNGLKGAFTQTILNMREDEKVAIRTAGKEWFGNEANVSAWRHSTALNKMAEIVKTFVADASIPH